jgi:predicted kinase
LRLGMQVAADSVNPLQITRAAWREVAVQAGNPYVEIECICSDLAEHRRRVESRTSDIAGFCLPTWEDVINRMYEPWNSEHIVIDTAGQSVEQSISALFSALSRL